MYDCHLTDVSKLFLRLHISAFALKQHIQFNNRKRVGNVCNYGMYLACVSTCNKKAIKWFTKK